ncbi:conserved protein of unknown function [Rhodovastum atsumiense]|uniref:DUF490 domain-containing protein n=1 Tax=Rhodovastum atsumiense TaxID=504468 RepID=A0A5M6IPK8_9PROT|nr:translocation/assembly module TamB domain-containing protein [Rhodovastum atsumiense]KAA5609498.1 DUF490 domain-containing protein [Rhodovastum atsumiense]CAH2600804.1 conserved protein of unknown function [Rhodovastum atsumiense]
MRALRILGWVTLALGILLLLVVAAVFVGLNTDAGRRLAERVTAQATGGMVVLQGLEGRFPDRLRLARVEIHDTGGAWLVVEDAALDWSPTKLLAGTAKVESLTAVRVAVPRLPVPAEPTPAPTSSSGGGFSLPVRVVADRVHVDRVEVGAPVAGAAAVLAVDGRAALDSLTQGSADVSVTRVDSPGTYHVWGDIGTDALQARLTAQEPAGGLISRMAGLPDLGAIDAYASVDGPWTGAATRLTLRAGELTASANGRIDLRGRSADLDVAAAAPAMRPRPDLAWQGIALKAHLTGPLATPEAAGTLRLDRLEAAGAGLRRLVADATVQHGLARLTASAEGIRLPGPQPGLLEDTPLRLTAEARLDAPDRPVRFDLSHPLIGLQGTARTAGGIAADATLDVPELGRLAAAGGVALQGSAKLDLKAAVEGEITQLQLDGTLGITGGMAPVPALIGPAATLTAAARLHGGDVTLSRLKLDGDGVTLAASGGLQGGAVALDWRVGLSDLSALSDRLLGTLSAQGRAEGPTDDLTVTSELTGLLATTGFPLGAIHAAVRARGLPSRPEASITAEGTLDAAPLTLAVSAARAIDGAVHVAIERTEWRSTRAEGTLDLPPGAVLPLGTLSLRVGSLDDFRGFVGRPLTGGIEATLRTEAEGGPPVARLSLRVTRAGLPGTATLNEATLTAEVRDPAGDPATDARLVVSGLQAGGIGGTVRLDAKGPQQALALRLNAALSGIAGADLATQAAATLDAPARTLSVGSLQARWQGETLRLLAPVRIAFADGLAIDRLRLGLRAAVLELAGRISPTLDLTASLRNVTADLARIVAPDLQADGRLEAQARLQGTTARPTGTLRLSATGWRMTTGAAAGLPAASLSADATLRGETARIDAALVAGRNRLTVAGTVPIAPDRALDLRAQGSIDLTTLNPILAADGRRLRGGVMLDASIGGTLAAPRPNGTVRIVDGEVQDFALGARLDEIQGTILVDGETIRIPRLGARAGRGTIVLGGSVGLAAPMPVDLTLVASDASPLRSDQLSVVLDANLALRGAVQQRMDTSGRIRIQRAEIRIPESMPAKVAVLNVRRPGEKPPPPPSPGPEIGLDITLTAPGRIFVRGRGLDAELAGDLHVGGTTLAPKPEGSFRLRRGEFNLAGQTLTFTKGEVGFDGSGKIDPTLDFVATTQTASVTASLEVTGYASKPQITLSSTPQLPQDEVLAQLLFGQSATSLGPLQIAQIAQAVAQISGVGGGFDPLNSVRSTLGLDRLTVSGGEGGRGAAVEAGRYVAPGLYVGARQGTNGSGTEAVVQMDLTRGLKLEATTGQSQGATGSSTTNDTNGTSIGLRYQFEY